MRWALLAAVFVSASAFAASKPAALVKEGDRLYKDGKYKEAAEVLKKAYELDPNPTILFNIARACDQAGEVQVALDTYRQYVSLPDTDPTLLKRANLAMDRLRTLIAQADAQKTQVEAEAKKVKEEAEAAKAKAEADAEAAKAKAAELERRERARQAEQRSKTSGRRVAAIAIGALAVAGLGTGLTFGLLANGAKSSFVNASTLQGKQTFEGRTKTYALVADVGFVAALACAVVFAVVFPWRAEPEGRVEVVLAPQGLWVGGRF
jgi:tetratricopeptide (TPR) repeat protein